jgi:hypothetical protein
MITDPILREKQVKALKAYYRDSNKQFAEWAANQRTSIESIPYPEFCRGMKCEAKTRSGHPCKNDGTNCGNGRCKYHGGASTGATTPEGKRIVSMNSRRQAACPVNKTID